MQLHHYKYNLSTKGVPSVVLTPLSNSCYLSYCPCLCVAARGVRRGGGTFACDRCGRMYKYRESLCRHRRMECGQEPRFNCQYCPYRAKQKCNLLSHMAAKHAREIHQLRQEIHALSQLNWSKISERAVRKHLYKWHIFHLF